MASVFKHHKLLPKKEKVQKEEKEYPSIAYLQPNPAIKPPYNVLLDTNFINFSIKNKIDVLEGLRACLLAKCVVYVTDCVVGEVETLGVFYKVALNIVKNPLFVRLKCTHKGIYADDCIVQRVDAHRIYIVATCDRELKQRLRKIPGVPIMYISQRKYTIEQLPSF